jgi:hypothetical protein
MKGLMEEVDAVEAQNRRAERAILGQREWAKTATKCVDFFEGTQWDAQVKAKREEAQRPTLTLNKIKRPVMLIIDYLNSQRQSLIARPSNDMMSSDDVGEVLSRLMSSIQDDCHFPDVQLEWLLEGLLSGRGYCDVRADYSRNPLGEVRMTSRDPFAVFPDPEAQSYDPSEPEGWMYVIENRWMSIEDVLVAYGKLAAREVRLLQAQIGSDSSTWESVFYDSSMTPEKYFGLVKLLDEGSLNTYGLHGGGPGIEHVDKQRRLLRVIDCQARERVKQKLFVDVVTGATAPIPDDWGNDQVSGVMQYATQMAEATGQPPRISIINRMQDKWRWTVTCGDTLLYDEWSPYSGPTLVPYFAYYRRGRTKGVVEDLLDAQEEHNRYRSNLAEVISKGSNGRTWAEEGSLTDETKANMELYGSSPGFLGYFKAGRQKPEVEQPPTLGQAHAELASLAENDVLSISGINESALGNTDDAAASGKAVLARQKQAAKQLGPLANNYERSMRLIGERMLDVVQKVYTEERIFRQRGEDGQETIYAVNRRQADGAVINDVCKGTYRIKVDIAPLSGVFDDLALELYKELMGLGVQVPPDMLIDAAPIPRKTELKDRVQEQMAAEQAMMLTGATDPAQGAQGAQGGGGAGKQKPPAAPANAA